MKKITVVLLLMVVLLCLSFSSLAAPNRPISITLVKSSNTINFTQNPQRNNYPLQVNSPIYTYEPWLISFSGSNLPVTPGDSSFQVKEIWDISYQQNKGDFLAFNIGVMVVPNVGSDYDAQPVMSARLWDIQVIIEDTLYPVEIVDSYSVTFVLPNITTDSSTQAQYVCYSLVFEIPDGLTNILSPDFSIGISANLNTYMWPEWPIQSFYFCFSDQPVQFENASTSTDIWANIFGNFLTPEKLEEQEENAEQAEEAGENVTGAMDTDVMSGDYGSGAQDGLNNIVVPLLDNPFISMILPVGVVLMLLLWGIHKGNS